MFIFIHLLLFNFHLIILTSRKRKEKNLIETDVLNCYSFRLKIAKISNSICFNENNILHFNFQPMNVRNE